jgi:hypothetical protein
MFDGSTDAHQEQHEARLHRIIGLLRTRNVRNGRMRAGFCCCR